MFNTERKSYYEYIESTEDKRTNVGFEYEGRIFEKTLSYISAEKKLSAWNRQPNRGQSWRRFRKSESSVLLEIEEKISWLFVEWSWSNSDKVKDQTVEATPRLDFNFYRLRSQRHNIQGQLHDARGQLHEARGQRHAARGQLHDAWGQLHDARGQLHDARSHPGTVSW